MSTENSKLPESWEEYCEMVGRDPKVLPDVSAYDDEDKNHAIADFKLVLLIKHCNAAVKPDYNNRSQIKREPIFEVVPNKDRPSGFGLSYHGYDGWFTHAVVGPRFAFVEPTVLKHMVTYFIDLYTDLHV